MGARREKRRPEHHRRVARDRRPVGVVLRALPVDLPLKQVPEQRARMRRRRVGSHRPVPVGHHAVDLRLHLRRRPIRIPRIEDGFSQLVRRAGPDVINDGLVPDDMPIGVHFKHAIAVVVPGQRKADRRVWAGTGGIVVNLVDRREPEIGANTLHGGADIHVQLVLNRDHLLAAKYVQPARERHAQPERKNRRRDHDLDHGEAETKMADPLH